MSPTLSFLKSMTITKKTFYQLKSLSTLLGWLKAMFFVVLFVILIQIHTIKLLQLSVKL